MKSTPFSLLAQQKQPRQPHQLQQHQQHQHLAFQLASRKNDNDFDDEDDDGTQQPQTGMNEAFEQFNALDSLFDDDDDDNDLTNKKSTTSGSRSTVRLDDDTKAVMSDAERASIEEEARLFQSMLQDSERQDETELYSDVIKDLGGTPPLPVPPNSKQQDDTTNDEQVNKKKKEKEPSVTVQDIFRANALVKNPKNSSIPDSVKDKDDFLNRAIQEALEEANKLAQQNSQGEKKITDTILDDEELMKEIEDIFEQGNEKLLASLEDIRQEQVRSAQGSKRGCAYHVTDKLFRTTTTG